MVKGLTPYFLDEIVPYDFFSKDLDWCTIVKLYQTYLNCFGEVLLALAVDNVQIHSDG
jgi:hypothetical protein